MTPAEVAAILTGGAAFVGAIFALVKFGLGERGTLMITQSQGAANILNAALETLNKEGERKDKRIAELEIQVARRDTCIEELRARLRSETDSAADPHTGG